MTTPAPPATNSPATNSPPANSPPIAPQPASPQPTGDNRTITFVEHFQPPWDSGNYSVSVSQAVSSSDAKNGFSDSFSGTLTFAVQGPRFTLPSDRVHTQFPPPGGNGEYSNVLPHVVLKDKTLPWQRLPGEPPAGGSVARTVGGGDVITPWLALLVFDQDDPAPTVTAGTLADLLQGNLPQGTVSYPGLDPDNLEYGEVTGSSGGSVYAPCQYIDIPWTLWAAIAPSFSDLYWQAHAREVSPAQAAQKAATSGAAPLKKLSVVVGNRLPTPGNVTLCCLVALEEMGPQLPPAPQNGTVAVRLAVLSSWSFGCVKEDETFASYFAQLDTCPATLQIPAPAESPMAAGAQPVADAFSMGYTAFTHWTRQGASTVSWYRGPLLPYLNQLVLASPHASADTLLRYDPRSGMFDTTYAAAWQLGQLLALADKGFATTLYNWKVGQQQTALNALEGEMLAEWIGLPADALMGAGAPRSTRLMNATIKPLLSALVKRGRDE